MELLRTITYQPAAGTKMCEQAMGKAGGGDSKKKRPQPSAEEPQPQAQVPPAAAHHRHHHSHSGPEISRIIVDPTTGKRYCRGKVLGKVTSGGAAGGGEGGEGRGDLPGQGRLGSPRGPPSQESAARLTWASYLPSWGSVCWGPGDRLSILSPKTLIRLESRSQGFL
jgi:hypothetical protein